MKTSTGTGGTWAGGTGGTGAGGTGAVYLVLDRQQLLTRRYSLQVQNDKRRQTLTSDLLIVVQSLTCREEESDGGHVAAVGGARTLIPAR